MKRLFFLILSILSVVYSSAQQQIGSYKCLGFEQPIELVLNNDPEMLLIGLNCIQSNARLAIDLNQVANFKKALIETRDKYVEWCKIAKNNNVKELEKFLGVEFPNIIIFWKRGGNMGWYYDFCQEFNLKFEIIGDAMGISQSWDLTAASNKYIHERAWIGFTSKEAMDVLIEQLDAGKINQSINNRELFK